MTTHDTRTNTRTLPLHQDLAKQLGSFLPEKLSLAGPIEFIADTAERDIDTAFYIANGMRSVHDSKSAFQVVGNVTTDASLFCTCM